MAQNEATPTEILMHEHRVIEKAIEVMREMVGILQSGKELPPMLLEETVDFIRNFADACHHAKEEGVLFMAMEARGLPRQGGPTGVMLLEHEQGRAFVRGLAEAVSRYKAGDASAKQTIIENATGYADLLTQHIQKEDTVLYPMADRILGPAEHHELIKRFEAVEAERPGAHEKYHALVHELETEVARCK
ncbi:MAG: hemerythrin domain-containing protein [Chloroflexi bacterium]|nr:hemerythrin domain-containing protein [Chloroflexota bacterium]